MSKPIPISQFNHQAQWLIDHFALDQKRGGCSLSIVHRGQLVTSIGAGEARENVPFTPTTLSLNFSTGKGILVTLIHVLVANKLLDYDIPIAHYWSAFGNNGKTTISLRHVLSHEAGLFDITSITQHAKDMLDWQAMIEKIETMNISQSKSDTQERDEKFVAYSALVSGWILGGLVEKVTHLDLQTALENYLLAPLNLIGQVYMGVPAEIVTKIARPFRDKEERAKPKMVEDSQATLDFYAMLPTYECWQKIAAKGNTDKPISKLTTQQINGLYFDSTKIDLSDYKSALVPVGSRQFNYFHPASLQAKIPAVNTVATGHALVTIYAMLANRGVWHHNIMIDLTTFEHLSKVQNSTQDKIMPALMNWRLGYHRVFSLCKDTKNAFGHMGYNGSMAWCDPSRELAVAFTHNYDVTMMTEIRQFMVNELVLANFS